MRWLPCLVRTPRPGPRVPAYRKLDPKRAAAAGLALDRDLAAMIAHHRLHDGEAQPGSVLLGGVVRSEQALALLLRQARPGIGDLEQGAPGGAVALRRPDGERAARGHGVERVQHQVLHGAM